MRNVISIVFLIASWTGLNAQVSNPEWCKALPRPEYKSLQRVPVSDPWFEVYKPAAESSRFMSLIKRKRRLAI